MAFEYVETDPPEGCICRWRNASERGGWDRISTAMGCPVHEPAQPPQTAPCKGKHCSAQIVWAVNAGGDRIPLDVVPRVGGSYEMAGRNANGVPVVRKLTSVKARTSRRLYVSHFDTCPDGGAFRESAPRPAARRRGRPSWRAS